MWNCGMVEWFVVFIEKSISTYFISTFLYLYSALNPLFLFGVLVTAAPHPHGYFNNMYWKTYMTSCQTYHNESSIDRNINRIFLFVIFVCTSVNEKICYFKVNNITVLSVISFLADKLQTPEDERENETRESRSRYLEMR